MTRSRIARPVDVSLALFDAVAVERRQRQYEGQVAGLRRDRGQPTVDPYDLAAMAMLRVDDNLSYEHVIPDIVEFRLLHCPDRVPRIRRTTAADRQRRVGLRPGLSDMGPVENRPDSISVRAMPASAARPRLQGGRPDQ
jgi:hypothetical protein